MVEEQAKKKRVAERQLTKDDPVDVDENSEEGERDPGSERAFNPNLKAGVFAKASEEELKTRRFVRAKRRGAVAPGTGAFLKAQQVGANQGGAAEKKEKEEEEEDNGTRAAKKEEEEAKSKTNPFAGISFSTGGGGGFGSVGGGEAKKVNPFAGVSFGSGAGGFGAVKPSAAGESVDDGPKKAEGGNASKDDKKADPSASAAATTAGTGAAGTANPFSGGFSFGGGSGAGGGFGAFSGGSKGFSFGSKLGAGTKTEDGGGGAETGAKDETPKSVAIGVKQGTVSKEFTEKETVTGEEDEESVFSASAVLFEYIDSSWKEKGRGQVNLNVNKESKKARLVMRANGSKRVILNANLWPEMVITPITNGVTFACLNVVKEGKTPQTYALRIPNTKEFQELLNKHKKA